MKKLPVPVGVFDQHIAVLGKTRSGKSSVMRLLVEHLLDKREPVCIIDPKGDWWGLRLSADGKGTGYDVVIFGDPALAERVDVAITDQVGADVAELLATGNRPALIDLGGWTVAGRTRFYNAFSEALFRHTTGDRWLVIDEVHNFAPKGTMRGQTERSAGGNLATSLHWTNRLASEGLGKGVHLIFASQRPQKVHNDTLTSAETLIAMRVLHPSDRAAYKLWIDGAGDQSGTEVLETVAQLVRGEGWAWSPEIGYGPKRQQFPLFSTYDSFKAQKREAAALKGWGDVDLEDLNANLARVQEQKKANDPTELRKQIATLKAELAKKVSAPAINRAPAPKTVEKPVLKDGQLARAEKILGQIDAVADRFSTFEEDLRVTAKEIRDAIAKTRVPDPHTPATMTQRVDRQVPVSPQARRVAPAPATSRPARLVSPSSNGSLGKAERAILAVLAQHPEGCEAGKLTLLTGYRYSGGFKNSLSALRQAGYMEGPNTGVMRITDGGIAALGDYDPLPTGSALGQYWLNHTSFGKAERAILAALLEHCEGLTADQLCRLTGYQYSGGFKNSLSALRTAGAMVGKNTGVMRAADALFD